MNTFAGVIFFSGEPREAAIYYEWLLGLRSQARPGAALAEIGVSHVLESNVLGRDAAGWVPVFRVDSIQSSLSRATDSGMAFVGEPVPGSEITVAENAFGVLTGLTTSESTEMPIREGAPLNCDYCALDVRVATESLVTLLGVESFSVVDDPFDMNILASDQRFVCGVLQMTGVEELSSRPYWLTYFEVSDIDQVVMRAIESGSRIVTPSSKSPFNTYAVLQDPWGNIFGLSQLDDQRAEDEVAVQLANGERSMLGIQIRMR